MIDVLNFKDIIRKSAVLFVLAVMCTVFAILAPNFRTFGNLIVILRQVSILGIVSAGMMIVLISGGIDLSVGSRLSIVSVITSSAVVFWGINPFFSIILGVAAGTLIGFLNGFIITRTGIPPIIETLAMNVMIFGLAFIVCKGKPIYGIPESYQTFGQGYIGPIPVPVVIMIIFFGITGFILKKTYIGRYFYAVGSNQEASRLSGLNIDRIKVIAYTFCGFLSSVAAIILMSRVNSGQPKAGYGFEMDVLTACVVGGVSINGGEGKISQVIIGTLIIGVLSNGLVIIGVSEYWQQVAKGAVLMSAVIFDSMQRTGKQKRQKTAA